MSDKVTKALTARLNRPGPGPSSKIIVVLELRSGGEHADTDGAKRAFAETSAPVSQAVRSLNGEVLGGAWINSTLKVKIPRTAVAVLAELEQVRIVDVPAPILPEAKTFAPRRVAAAVHARGPAVRLASRNIEKYLAAKVAQGDVLWYSKPGEWADHRSGEAGNAYLLVVPEDGHARHYPRSINSVPVRIARSGEGRTAPAGLE